MKRWVYEALAAVVALCFTLSARLCAPAPLDPFPLPVMSSDRLELLAQRIRPTDRGNSPRSTAKGKNSMKTTDVPHARSEADAVRTPIFNPVDPAIVVPRMRLAADGFTPVDPREDSFSQVEIHSGDLADLLWINFRLFAAMFAHLFIGDFADPEEYISLEGLSRACDPEIPSPVPYRARIFQLVPLLQRFARAKEGEHAEHKETVLIFRELVLECRADQLGLRGSSAEGSSQASGDALDLNFRAEFSGEPPFVLQLGGSRVRFSRALRELGDQVSGSVEFAKMLVNLAVSKLGPHLASIARPPASGDSMNVGSHPSRARALGREDRDRGMPRRSTEEIFAAVGFDPNQAPQELIEKAAFELRTAYDAAYNLPKA